MTDERYDARPTRVTVTGADDLVDPRELVALSTRFPFVEWGILFSSSRAGQPRYPTEGWIRSLVRTIRHQPVHLAAHFCGARARDALNGFELWNDDLRPAFDRVQLNGYEALTSAFCDMVNGVTSGGPEYILQARTVAGLATALRDRGRITRGSVLVDPSGGRGLDAHAMWAAVEAGDEWIGFAGGITPNNVADVIGFLNERRSGPFWIDMESGVRTDGLFDLGLVVEVLEAVAEVGSCR